MSALTGNQAMFTLTVEGCDEELRVVRFAGREAISTLFEFRLEVASETVPLADLVGQPALLKIDGLEGVRHVHGFVCEAGYIGETSSYTLHELTLVPAIWRLHQRSGCKIFQGDTTPQILTRVLEAAKLPRSQFRLELQATYEPRDYCVQYRESDLDFISRLMEENGIYYYFEHDADRHVLVMTDRGDGGSPIAGRSTLQLSGAHERERLSHFRVSEGVRPQRTALRDKNLHTPDVGLEAVEGAGEREIYDWAGRYQQLGKGEAPHLGGKQAKLRLEALQAPRRRGFGSSDSPRLVPGCTFELVDGVRAHLEGEYRLLAVRHRGEQPQVLDEGATGAFRYDNDFECHDKRLPYRAPRVTPRPTVHGAQTATVVGPGAEEIHTDEHGRVKVQFHWDRRDAHDDTSSCWVRVSQMWAGNGFGAMFLPRVGHEVIVDFLEGDPDRPIITGRVYTGLNAPPYPLPDEKTKSTIKSESSPGGGGSNELRFEDAKGSEEIFLHGQRDWNIVIEHDKAQEVGHDEALRVGNDRSKTVGHDQQETIGNNKTIVVGATHDETIGVDMTLMVGANLAATVGANVSLAVGGGVTVGIGGGRSTAVGGSSHEEVAGECVVTVGGGQTVAVAGALSEAVGGGKSAAVGGDSSESVGGGKSVSAAENVAQSAGKNLALSAGKHVNVSAGENLNVSAGKSAALLAADKLTIKCGDATVTLKKSGEVTIQASKLSVKASGDVVIKGSNIKMN